MKHLLFLWLTVQLLSSCTSTTSKKTTIDSKDWKPTEVKYAKNFKLKRAGDRFLLELYKPGTTEIIQTEILDPKKNKRIISLTATLNGMLCLLNERDRIIGISSKDYLFDGTLKKRVVSGKIGAFGDASQLSLERIVNAKPNLILYDIVDNQFPNQEKLNRLGIRVLPIYDWRETHPLAKAEWIKVVGALAGKYDEACKMYAEIENSYKALKELQKDIENRPTVICGNLIGDFWYTPGGDNYFATLIKDAGADYRYKESKGSASLALSLEQILKDNKTTEIWLNPGMAKKKQILQLNPHADLLKAWETGTYCYSGNMNKFWELSAARPDLVLNDLIHVFHPELDPDFKFEYYGRIKE